MSFSSTLGGEQNGREGEKKRGSAHDHLKKVIGKRKRGRGPEAEKIPLFFKHSPSEGRSCEADKGKEKGEKRRSAFQLSIHNLNFTQN